jgi:hypothetical protein
MQTSTMIAIAVAIIAGLAVLYIISYLKDKKRREKFDYGQTKR